MSKIKTKYICSNCGHESIRWLGKCPTCDSWNTFTEEKVEDKKSSKNNIINKVVPLKLAEINYIEDDRIKTNIEEFDRVLGGGLMPGSVILIGGDPGIGKSTLVMQASASIRRKVLYITGEESARQISLRANRLKTNSDNILILAETNIETILDAIEENEPDVIIIDSIQTMYSSQLENAPGTITQIRESTALLMDIAKKNNYCIILIGHVTKEGYIAGPKILEHIVDTVLQFEGERHHTYRILRSQKNRFGSTNEIGIFEMHDIGLSEVTNPSQLFLSEKTENTTGSVIAASIEGTRPILLEVQALVTPMNYGNPQRVATGFDNRRLSILLAVLEKRAGVRLSNANVFLNLVGGVRIDEPAIDLAVCASIASSFLDKPVKENSVAIGEVGLGGEIRTVGNIDKRLIEAEKMGFETAIIPKNNRIKNNKYKIEIISVESIHHAINKILL